MDAIKLATAEEIESIRKDSDLGPGCSVWSMGRVLGVVRNSVELDPIFFNDCPDTRKVVFMWGMENIFRAQGIPAYYFNVPANEEATRQRETVEKMGFERVSKEPEFRYKKAL